ncbi:GntR family transcriptional regulator [Terracoccus sp. 273MFTsu3.1]|uniref:GntR family transcriptional regulator n=1 Tax=Terracoccus sp. 273MFTsu3.1 TaxID=1172188 RepID=UPI00039AC987|nr:GntR family transcriptional regulator [Terracoccus sp. 273MFTsu3.1]
MPTREEHAGSLRDSVTEALRGRIVSGELAPGARLVERQVAEQLGVSRVPVREALRALEREGFLEERPTRGMVVRRLDPDDVAMLFAVRESLEAVLSHRLVDVLDDDGLASLDDLVTRADAHARAGRQAEAIGANAAFHDALVDLAGSRVLSSIIEPVAGRMAWLLNQHTEPASMVAEHRAIVEALRSRDADRAAAVFRDHLASSRAAVTSLDTEA